MIDGYQSKLETEKETANKLEADIKVNFDKDSEEKSL